MSRRRRRWWRSARLWWLVGAIGWYASATLMLAGGAEAPALIAFAIGCAYVAIGAVAS